MCLPFFKWEKISNRSQLRDLLIVWYESDLFHLQFSSVQSLSCVRLFATPCIAARQASLSITNSQSSLGLNVHRVGDAIQPSHPLSSPFPSAPNPSQHQSLFQWVNSSHEVAKVLSFSFSIIPSKEIPGLISFRMDWLDLLAVHGTPCSPWDS